MESRQYTSALRPTVDLPSIAFIASLSSSSGSDLCLDQQSVPPVSFRESAKCAPVEPYISVAVVSCNNRFLFTRHFNVQIDRQMLVEDKPLEVGSASNYDRIACLLLFLVIPQKSRYPIRQQVEVAP